jgi:hypothetical protein
MRKTDLAICAAAALGFCLMIPKGVSAFPAAAGADKAYTQTVTGKSAAVPVYWRRGYWGGRVGFGRGYGWGWRRAAWRGAGWGRGYYGGWGGYGLGLGYGLGTGWGYGGSYAATSGGCYRPVYVQPCGCGCGGGGLFGGLFQ